MTQWSWLSQGDGVRRSPTESKPARASESFSESPQTQWRLVMSGPGMISFKLNRPRLIMTQWSWLSHGDGVRRSPVTVSDWSDSIHSHGDHAINHELKCYCKSSLLSQFSVCRKSFVVSASSSARPAPRAVRHLTLEIQQEADSPSLSPTAAVDSPQPPSPERATSPSVGESIRRDRYLYTTILY